MAAFTAACALESEVPTGTTTAAAVGDDLYASLAVDRHEGFTSRGVRFRTSTIEYSRERLNNNIECEHAPSKGDFCELEFNRYYGHDAGPNGEALDFRYEINIRMAVTTQCRNAGSLFGWGVGEWQTKRWNPNSAGYLHFPWIGGDNPFVDGRYSHSASGVFQHTMWFADNTLHHEETDNAVIFGPGFYSGYREWSGYVDAVGMHSFDLTVNDARSAPTDLTVRVGQRRPVWFRSSSRSEDSDYGPFVVTDTVRCAGPFERVAN